MRKLLLLLLFIGGISSIRPVFAVDWGDSGLNVIGAPREVYIAWEASSQFGDPSGEKQNAYFAFANTDYLFMQYPVSGAPDTKIDWNCMIMPDDGRFQYFRTIASKVNTYLSEVVVDWLYYFTTKSGEAAEVTFRCIKNDLPANTTVTLKFIAVDGTETLIDCLNEDETFTISVTPSDVPNTIMAIYTIPQMADAEYALSLEPGWNLVGIPFLAVSDAGALFDCTVLRCAVSPVRVRNASELVSGASYWVFNPGSERRTVTLKGTARKGGETDFPALAAGWNYLGVVGAYNEGTKDFAPATSVHDYNQWRWIPGGAFFREEAAAPAVGVGYMVTK